MTERGPVLVGIDFSPASDEALGEGRQLADELATELMVCHVLPEVMHVRCSFRNGLVSIQTSSRRSAATQRKRSNVSSAPCLAASAATRQCSSIREHLNLKRYFRRSRAPPHSSRASFSDSTLDRCLPSRESDTSTLNATRTLPAQHYLNTGHGLASWLLTKDHKRIAILCLIAITGFFFVGRSHGGRHPLAKRCHLLRARHSIKQEAT